MPVSCFEPVAQFRQQKKKKKGEKNTKQSGNKEANELSLDNNGTKGLRYFVSLFNK